MKSIVLVGLMGAGKTAVGKILSDKLGYEFLDTDNIIEQEENCKISDIFSSKGEQYFRELENKLVLRLQNEENKIISTGGGLFQNKENITNLAKNGYIIYLQASPEILYSRIKEDFSRPLLQNTDPLSKLSNLLKKRENNYKLANLTINTENKTINEISDEIIKEYYANS